MVLASMTIGNVLSSYLTPETAKIIGGFILISIGLFNLVNVIRSKKRSPDNAPINKSIPQEKQWKIHLKN